MCTDLSDLHWQVKQERFPSSVAIKEEVGTHNVCDNIEQKEV